MARVILDAGHFKNDPGCSYAGYTERDICMRIRDEVAKLFPNVILVPDEYNLRQTIDWINSFVQKDDLCISIHLNFNNNPEIEGTVCFYSDVPYLADIFSRHISKSLQTRNLGSKHDSETYVGSLGWLRQIKGQNVLVEVCFLSSHRDRMKIVFPSGQIKVAQGIVDAIKEVQGNLSILEQLKVILSKLLKLIK